MFWILFPSLGFARDDWRRRREPGIWKSWWKFFVANMMMRTIVLWPVASIWYYRSVHKKQVAL
jgi:hypothetical protein